jgi:hypothetical protein
MASARISIPQSFNRYAFVLNNPLRFMDPTGMYICEGTNDECSDFDNALQRIMKKDRNKAIGIRAAKAYGQLGEKNGVRVRFVDALENNRGGRVDKIGMGLDQDPLNPSSYQASLMVSILKSQIKNQEIIAHEGSHVADYQAYVRSLSEDLTEGDDSLNITKRESEMRAWQLSVSMQINSNVRPNYGTCGVDECIFTPSTLPATRDRLINQLLSDPRNSYKGLDIKLYPEFQTPQK